MPKLNYVEMPVADIARAGAFFRRAFGWNFTDYGPEYAAHEEAPCQLGLNGSTEHGIAAILPVIETEDLEATHDLVIEAGGTITREIFAFPGGRRFHFREPGGLELGVYVTEA